MATIFGRELTDNLSMTDVLAKMNEGRGLARSARFAVKINGIPGINQDGLNELDRFRRGSLEFGKMRSIQNNDLVYLCEVAEFPGRTYMNSDIRYYGPSVKFPFQTVYEDVNFTFLCRMDFDERKFFDTWMEMINPISTYDFNYKSEYSTSIDIFQLDEKQKPVYCITLLEAYPLQVSPQPVTWADDNFQRLAVTFTYSKWGRNRIDYNFYENEILDRSR